MIVSFKTPAAAAAGLAGRVVADAADAIAARGNFRLALSGGETPAALYRLLASEYRESVDWARVTLLFADERAVPRGDAERNDRLADELLVAPLGIAPAHVRRMPAESPDLDAAARAYEGELAEPIDLLLLGVGPDGHIASLFPGHAAVEERVRRVLPVTDSPKPPPRRLTLTPRALAEARDVCVLVTGEAKAAAVARVFGGPVSADRCPAVLAKDADWFVDVAAGSGLPDDS